MKQLYFFKKENMDTMQAFTVPTLSKSDCIGLANLILFFWYALHVNLAAPVTQTLIWVLCIVLYPF
jgi:hypothetical protein